MSVWFASERWIFDWHNGNKLLLDLLAEHSRRFLSLRPVAWVVKHAVPEVSSNGRIAQSGSHAIRAVKRVLSRLFPSESASADLRSAADDTAASDYTVEPSGPTDLEAQSPLERLSFADATHPSLTGRDRFIRVVRRVMVTQQAAGNIQSRRAVVRPSMRSSRRHYTGLSDVSTTVPSGILSTLVPRLMNLEVMHTLDLHTGLVRDLQFSPDGSLLATTGCVVPTDHLRMLTFIFLSWDRRTTILRIDVSLNLIYNDDGY